MPPSMYPQAFRSGFGRAGGVAMAFWGVLTAGVGLSGCGGYDALEGTQVRFARGGSDFWDLPWPEAADTHARLTSLPNPRSNDLVEQAFAILQNSDGASRTAGIFFAFDGPLAEGLRLSPAASLAEDALVFVAELDAAGTAVSRRIPVEVIAAADGGPFGAPNLLALIPVQGVALAAGRRHLAVVRRALGDAAGKPLGRPEAVAALLEASAGSDLGQGDGAYGAALDAVGIDRDEVAALTLFTTGHPEAGLAKVVEAMRDRGVPAFDAAPTLTEVYDDFCVFQALVSMPVYQEGSPPYTFGGGAWVFDGAGAPVLHHEEQANVWLTVPRQAAPAAGYPAVLFVRTGGGGNRPLIDRGRHAVAGGDAVEAGEGPARYLARAGWLGVSIDGPHGGRRNISGSDEQFLVFNFANAAALRDNVRQSAAEMALASELVAELSFAGDACPGAGVVHVDASHLALMGHSMGGTIAPIAAAAAPGVGGLVLSGAGSSWLENLLYKRKPLDVRAVAELMLGYTEEGRALRRDDPVVSLIQWALEAADPPIYGEALRSQHVLIFQGIVDHYIMPPIANATNLSFAVDLAGPAREGESDELFGLPTALGVLPLAGGSAVSLPTQGNRDGGARTAVVVQHGEDGLEDGHEVMYQLDVPKAQYRCFLATWAAGTPRLIDATGLDDSCD